MGFLNATATTQRGFALALHWLQSQPKKTAGEQQVKIDFFYFERPLQ